MNLRPALAFLAATTLACGSSTSGSSASSGSSSSTSTSSTTSASSTSTGSTTASSSTSSGSSTASGSGSGTTGSTSASSGSGSSGGTTSSCPLTVDTSPTSTVTNGCTLLSRDTSSCQAARSAQGLSGAWLEFSCRVTLTKTTVNGKDVVTIATDSQPDYVSNYFATSSPCYAAFSPSFPDPNQISAQSLSINVPLAPDTTQTAMGLGPVGVAINGVAIFDNQAAPGDDIFQESGSFDQCQGHPAPGGVYHYHSEPYAISSADSELIGVLKDGYFVYGQLDADGSTPTLDAAGGHTGTTPDSPSTPVYHHHLNLQISTNTGTAGERVEFITTGTYAGTPG
ncbi:MAG: YHYH protein [Deltaproteobacteria bacterium]|nr:YHYH protein [Deltaproteobacteria bacterium]